MTFSVKQIAYIFSRVKRGIRPRFTQTLRAAKARPLELVPSGPSLRYAVVNDRGTRIADIALDKPKRGILRVKSFESMMPRGTLPAGSVRDIGRQVMGYWKPKANRLARQIGSGPTAAQIGKGRGIPDPGMVKRNLEPREIMESNFGRRVPPVMISKIPGFGKTTPGLRLPTAQEIEKGTWKLGSGQERTINFPKRMSRQDFRAAAWSVYDYARKNKIVGTAQHKKLASALARGVSGPGRKGDLNRIYAAAMTGLDKPTYGVIHRTTPRLRR